MNNKSLELLEKYVPKSNINQAVQSKATHENEIRILLEKVKYLYFNKKKKNKK
jgi:hypothetical protein